MGTLSKPFWKSGQEQNTVPKDLELRINDVRLLDSLLETTGKRVIFKIDVAEMNEQRVSEFIQLVKSHPGKQSFGVHLTDSISHLTCNMTPFSGGVSAQEILPLVEKLSYADFDLK